MILLYFNNKKENRCFSGHIIAKQRKEKKVFNFVV